MTSLDKLYKFKELNTRCYYIDSDGDEVIVSDEEDFDVAIEYAHGKKNSNFDIFKCKPQDESDEEEAKAEPNLNSKSSLKMVADTVSVGGQDVFESSDDEVDGIEEIESGLTITTNQSQKQEEEMDKKLSANVAETVSRDNSIALANEEIESFNAKEEKQFKSISESVYEDDAHQNNLDCQPIEEAKVVNAIDESQIIKNNYEIITSVMVEKINNVHDYVPVEEPQPEVAVQPVEVEPEIIQNRNSDLNEDERIEFLAEGNKYGVLEPDEVAQDEHKDDVVPKSDKAIYEESLEELKLLEMNSSVADSQVDEDPNEEFKDAPRQSVAMSIAKAQVVHGNNHKNVNILKKAIESVKFVFECPDKRMKIAQVDNSDEEKSQDFVITCKPGKTTKKRWRIVNNSSIRWPKNVILECQQENAKVEMPKIDAQLRPGEKMDISVNITIDENITDNIVQVYVFRLYSSFYGSFGEPLIATVEVIPEVAKNPISDLSQEEKLKELFEGDDINPILYEIANDFVDEGLGNFEQCLEALLQCKNNYTEARDKLKNMIDEAAGDE